jgi:hypothetical protein
MVKYDFKKVQPFSQKAFCHNVRRLRAHLAIPRSVLVEFGEIPLMTQYRVEKQKTADTMVSTVTAYLWVFNQAVREGCEITMEDLLNPSLNINKILPKRRSV